MANSSVASPVITLGVDAGGVKSGMKEAQAAMKSAADAIAAIANQIKSKPIQLGVNSQQMLSDLSGLTDTVESTVKLFERLQKSSEKAMKDTAKAVTSSPVAKPGEGGSFFGSVFKGLAETGKAPASFLKMLSEATMPLNQGLELAGKVNRVLGAPIRSAMASEGGNENVAAGGIHLLGSGTLSGTFARFERQVEQLFTDIWNGIDNAIGLQNIIESVRGGFAAISVIIQSAFGPFNEMGKDPKKLFESFKAGGDLVIDAFEKVGKIAVEITNAWIDVVNSIKKLNILGKEYTDDEEKLIEQEQKRFLDQQNPRAGLDAIKDKVGRDLLNGPAFPDFMRPNANPWKAEDNNFGLIGRNDAIKELERQGLLKNKELGKFGFEGVEKLAKEARDKWANVQFNPGVGQGDLLQANKALEDFTRGLRGSLDPIQGITDAYEASIRTIEASSADVIQYLDALEAADEKFAADIGNLARSKFEDQAKSFSPGGALDSGSKAYAEALVKAMNNGRAGQGDVAGRSLAAMEAIKAQTKRANEQNAEILKAIQSSLGNGPQWIGQIPRA